MVDTGKQRVYTDGVKSDARSTGVAMSILKAWTNWTRWKADSVWSFF